MNQEDLVLRTERITKEFGYKTVLKGVDLELYKGQMTLLLGTNGAGKSTLLKIMSGLVRPSSGDIYFMSQKIQCVSAEFRQSIGVISHAIHFYSELTARENLLFFNRLRKIQNLREKVERAIVQTGLENAADAPVKTFSSGMSKRLNIARLIVSQPRILLLDEPYSGLDYDSIEFFNKYLLEFKQQNGAILLISHQIETCFNLCDRIAILKQGIIDSCNQTKSLSRTEIVRKYQGTR
ncbi:heme ABC exporter ATP-binding protein CcmA [bacterium]|nr:heme ABC exporter ATP-binding protein CcmA [bacterium]